MPEKLIEIKSVSKHYNKKDWKGDIRGSIRVLNQIDLTIYKGEILGLVGESGSGKSTLGKLILNFERLSQGEIIFENKILQNTEQMNPIVSNQMQLIFQDPYSALNPYMSAVELVMEPLIHIEKSEAEKMAAAVLDRVGIDKASMNRRARSFSGGQRQRIGIARAIVNKPKFIVCDEPTSVLDVSIQAQVLELLLNLQKELDLTYLFISHDLSVVRKIADRIAVMCQGHLVELGKVEDVFQNPQHPYTKNLLSAMPNINPIEAKDALESFVYRTVELGKNSEWLEIELDHFVRNNN